MLYEQFGELKYKYRNRESWCRGYYVDTVGKNETRIAEYIKNQLKEDELGEQMTIASIGPITEEKYSTKKSGQQGTIPAQLADRITHLRVTRGTEGFARIGRTPSFTGGLLFSKTACMQNSHA